MKSNIDPEQVLNEIVQEGEWMAAFVESEHYQRVRDLIIEPMRKAAFDAFVTILNPEDRDKLLTYQLMAQAANEFERRIEDKIVQGKAALAQLISTPEEDEEDERVYREGD